MGNEPPTNRPHYPLSTPEAPDRMVSFISVSSAFCCDEHQVDCSLLLSGGHLLITVTDDEVSSLGDTHLEANRMHVACKRGDATLVELPPQPLPPANGAQKYVALLRA
jgi:hypothetical protein